MRNLIVKILLYLSIITGLGYSTPGFSNPLNIPEEKLKKLAYSKEWLRLVHYDKGLFGFSARADGKNFYLAEDGKTNPFSELKASIKHFLNEESSREDHPICQFPARVKWIEKVFPKIDIPEMSCEDYEKFVERVDLNKVYLVFSSYYLNNPSSAYGHTFLRFSRSNEHSYSHELMDSGINFAANPTTTNPLAYAVMGIIGGFKGHLTNIPYYYKVREYNDFESRDLWSYELNLNKDEMEMLVAHVWEIGGTYFDYFYFTENCSYLIFAALEAAKPSLNLLDNLPFWIIPSDTVLTAIETKGLVKNIYYRPSIRKQFYHKLKLLDEVEKKILKKSLINQDPIIKDNISEERKAKILDTALDYIDYKHPEQNNTKKDLTKKSIKVKQKFLFARARNKTISPKITVPMPLEEAPHLGHNSSRFSISSEKFLNEDAIRIEQRFSHHDFLDRSVGYPETAQIEMFNISGRYLLDSKDIELDKFTLLKIKSFSPLSYFEKPTSWQLELSLKKDLSSNCDLCDSVNFQTGFGHTLSFFNEKLMAYTLWNVRANYSPSYFNEEFLLTLFPEVGLLIFLNSKIRASIAYQYLFYFNGQNNYEYTLNTQLRFSLSQNFAIDMKANLLRDFDSKVFSLGINYYY